MQIFELNVNVLSTSIFLQYIILANISFCNMVLYNKYALFESLYIKDSSDEEMRKLHDEVLVLRKEKRSLQRDLKKKLSSSNVPTV